MAQVVNLDDILGEDAVIQYRGVEYKLPADPPVEYILALWQATQRMQNPLSLEEQAECMNDLCGRLLAVFRLADPNLKSLPFGTQGLVAVSKLIFSLVGIATHEEDEIEAVEEEPDPLARPSRSRRSSGSRRS
jgi:hypothetical protein